MFGWLLLLGGIFWKILGWPIHEGEAEDWQGMSKTLSTCTPTLLFFFLLPRLEKIGEVWGEMNGVVDRAKVVDRITPPLLYTSSLILLPSFSNPESGRTRGWHVTKEGGSILHVKH